MTIIKDLSDLDFQKAGIDKPHKLTESEVSGNH